MTFEDAQRLFTGRWDRIATFGKKVQEHTGEDGEVVRQEWDFTEETFAEWVENFDRLYKGRHLPYDFEHQALAGAANTQPVQHLAYANGLCAIKEGKVYAFLCQDPEVAAPDPVELLTQIQERYPSDPDADGCWAFRCGVTPLGVRCLPNLEQLSPTFDDKNKDEAARPIGSRAMTISVVCVAHQDRTVLNLPTEARQGGLGGLSALVRALGPAQLQSGLSALAAGLRKGHRPKGALSMDEKKPGEGEKKPDTGAMSADEYTGKLGQFMGEDKDEDKALAAYALGTEDPPAMRARMAAFRASKMGAETGATAEGADDKDKDDKDKGKLGAFGVRLAQAEAKAQQAEVKAQQAVAQLDAASKREKLAAFAQRMQAEGRSLSTDALTGLGDSLGLAEAEKWVQKNVPKSAGALGRRTLGGNPIGTSASAAHEAVGAFSATASGNVHRGAGLSALALKIADRDKIDFGAALIKAQQERPDLY